MFQSLFKSAFATRTEIQFTCRRFRSQQSHSKRSRPRGGFSAQHLRDLDASAPRGTIAKCVWVTPYGVPRPHEFPFRRAANAAAIPEGWAAPSNRGGRFSAKAALTSRTLSPCGFSRWRRSAAASSNLLHAISLSVRFMPRAAYRRIRRKLCRVHESESGTKQM